MKGVDEQALEPLQSALLTRARRQTAARVSRARSETTVEFDTARADADNAVLEARRRGEAEGANAVAIDDAIVRRQVHTMLLAARRSVYEQLRLKTRSGVMQLHGEPIYRELRDAMTSAGRSLIGADATVRDIDDGCVIESSGRRVEVTLRSLADWALDGVLADSPEWTP